MSIREIIGANLDYKFTSQGLHKFLDFFGLQFLIAIAVMAGMCAVAGIFFLWYSRSPKKWSTLKGFIVQTTFWILLSIILALLTPIINSFNR